MSDPPINVPIVEPGVYESLLTARLHQLLAASEDQVTDYKYVDEADQPHVIARHLAGLIEQAIQTARTPEARVAIVRDVLSALP